MFILLSVLTTAMRFVCFAAQFLASTSRTKLFLHRTAIEASAMLLGQIFIVCSALVLKLSALSNHPPTHPHHTQTHIKGIFRIAVFKDQNSFSAKRGENLYFLNAVVVVVNTIL